MKQKYIPFYLDNNSNNLPFYLTKDKRGNDVIYINSKNMIYTNTKNSNIGQQLNLFTRCFNQGIYSLYKVNDELSLVKQFINNDIFIKKFEEFAFSNPEISYQYHKLLNDENLNKKYNKEDSLPIITIIYILYIFYYEKFSNKEEVVFHMCYFLINKLKNISYAMLLCSRLKSKGHKSLYYKYLLTEDIKQYSELKP